MNGDTTPAPSSESSKMQLKVEVPWREKISRLFIFRFLWVFVLVWVLYVWMIWIGLVNFVHFWYMLILGKKHQAMWKKNVRFFKTMTEWNSYLSNLTDERPKFIGDKV
ncbi:MAG TPA: DUF4389 domain-containing protein [Candidatus Bipolaricaulota bacterium]|nr:DUF4389 domain-containing protein [Candidatus Bipolaricaulota bacterium]